MTWPHSNPFCRQNACSSCNSGNDLVVVFEHIFVKLCSNAEQILVRLARFRRSYINRPAVVLTTAQATLLFCLICAVLFKVATFLFFCNCLSPTIVYLRNRFLLNTAVAGILLTSRWVRRRKDVK